MSNTNSSLIYRNSKELDPIIHLWILRILVSLGCHKQIFSKTGILRDEIALEIGLGKWVDPATEEFDMKLASQELRKLHLLAEQNPKIHVAQSCLSKNLARLAKVVGLSNVDCQLLEFSVLLHNESIFEEATELLGNVSSLKLFRVLSIILNISESKIRQALNNTGTLSRTGLLCINSSRNSTLRDRLNLLSDNFANAIATFDTDPITLLKDVIVRSSPAHLKIEDFDHITEFLSVLRPYLRLALKSKKPGVNIFIHGDPGTGKSQLARVLSQELGCNLFEISSENSDGELIEGYSRLRAYSVAQSVFSNTKSLILFDEVEDIFNDGNGFMGQRSTAQMHKAWINKRLEENPVPTLWLSNTIRGLDRAFVRRFDMLIELPIPPKAKRERIIQETCSHIIDNTVIKRISESESLSPAVVSRAAAVVESIAADLKEIGTTAAFELIITNTLRAQGHKPIKINDSNRLPDIYDPFFINSDIDLMVVANGLAQSNFGRICLYGPPGTGKTAYGRFLAEYLEKPLVTKRASDLMSMWHGESEKNIASAFQEAGNNDAILMIDEVDGFLQDRRNVNRGWEVNLVNEMLTQIESFSGIFIASTNLMDDLDQASLRRFDMKLKFDYLRPEQAANMFKSYCKKLDLTKPSSQITYDISRLKNLTPGDFAAVSRQSKFFPIRNTETLFSLLEKECRLKHTSSMTMGFM